MGDDPTRTLTHQDSGPAAAGEGLLEVLEGAADPSKTTFEVSRRGLIVGRGDVADVRVEADGVSRKHAKIVDNGHGVVNVLDLGSRNGTFVNGRRIDVAVLRSGDQLKVGRALLRFRLKGDKLATQANTGPTPESVLTAREYEVAELVADGMTNAEIGKRLHISPRTVATHLANVYERLDIHSRAALAKYVTVGKR